MPDFTRCLLTERDDLVVDQAGLTQPGGHQDHGALAGIRQLKQGVGIADLNVVGAEAFFIQLLFSDSDDLIELAIAGGQFSATALSTL